MSETMIKFDNVTKEYRLGQIGGGTLRGDLQSWWARKRGKEDPNATIGSNPVEIGKRFLALDGVSFEVKRGEALGIIGHNGAGKSTLLKLLSRVTGPTSGAISYNGRVASMLEVGTGFHPEMTGRENIYMNGAILGMTKAEIDAKMEDIIEFSEVRQFIDTPVKRYSSGMYVKLAFAVAAHLDSEIMVMDEVLAVGDMAFQKKCLGKMGDAANQEGRTILYVSHNMNTIRQLCDRCIVLNRGKLVFDGDVEKAIELYTSKSDYPLAVDIDLSHTTMRHLIGFNIGKMTRIQFLGKERAIYEMREDIDFLLSVTAGRDIEKICFRMEIRSTDGALVGTARLHDFASIRAGESAVYPMRVNFDGLVPGKYMALLVLYEVNEYGAEGVIDAVYQEVFFEVTDPENILQLQWSSSYGHVLFGNIALHTPNEVGEWKE